MILAPTPAGKTSLLLVETCLTAITVAAAFAWPRLFAGWFTRIERFLSRLARRRLLAVTAVGSSAIVLRIAILAWFPVPLPFLPDDFSFLLGADTFVHGRLANPTPAMWVHFETIFVDMQPTYASMYFPGQALFLAAGKVLLGNPWYGVLISSALMCAGICWMLQAWLPPGWALLGGMIAVLRLGLFSYWINTYTGGGFIAAFGGALVLGSFPRLMKTASFRYGLLLATGIVLLILTRPYEGMLLCLPVAVVLGRWIWSGKNRPRMAVLLRRAALPLALIASSIGWLGYFDYRAFGSPFTLPYTVNRATYAIAPYFVWQPLRREPVYRREAIRDFYRNAELKVAAKIRTPFAFTATSFFKAYIVLLFFAGIALLPPLFMMRRVFLDRRVRFLVLSVPLYMAGMVIQVFLVPHYLAPFTAAFYAIGLQAMRHLRLWTSGAKPVGLTIVRLAFPLCLLMAAIRLFSAPLGFSVSRLEPADWSGRWYGPDHYGTERAQIESHLELMPGKQLAVVRYSPQRSDMNQWVYNSADIQDSKVIWAWEMGSADDLDLLHHYNDRKMWLIHTETDPVSITPYPVPESVGSQSILHSSNRSLPLSPNPHSQ